MFFLPPRTHPSQALKPHLQPPAWKSTLITLADVLSTWSQPPYAAVSASSIIVIIAFT